MLRPLNIKELKPNTELFGLRSISALLELPLTAALIDNFPKSSRIAGELFIILPVSPSNRVIEFAVTFSGPTTRLPNALNKSV